MTPEERAGWVHDKWLNGDYAETSLVKALAAVIREEIEACAALADWPKPAYYLPGTALNDQAVLCNGIAAAIRARK